MRTIVLSVGGSLLSPKEIDQNFLQGIIALVKSRKERIIIVTGGGYLARQCIAAVPDAVADAKDRIGIAATRLHAQLVLEGLATAGVDVCPKVLTAVRLPNAHTCYVAGGFTPGRTTDDVATMFAIANGGEVINLTNINGVYTKDPREPGAERIPAMSWKQYKKMFKVHAPGMHAPFDPVAARRASRKGLRVLIMNGSDIAAVGRAIDDTQSADGTIIS